MASAAAAAAEAAASAVAKEAARAAWAAFDDCIYSEDLLTSVGGGDWLVKSSIETSVQIQTRLLFLCPPSMLLSDIDATWIRGSHFN